MLKRLTIFFVFLSTFINVYAQYYTSELCKEWLMEDINRGRFEYAIKDLDGITDWRFVPPFKFIEVDFNKVDTFLVYLSSLDIANDKLDSVIVYASFYARYCGEKYHARGFNFEKIAQEYTFKALKYAEFVYGKNHPACLHLYENIAVSYMVLENGSMAVQYFQKAKEIVQNQPSQDLAELARILSGLCAAYTQIGEYQKGEDACLGSLKIRETTLGDTLSHGYALNLDNYCSVLDGHKNFKKAIEKAQKALYIRSEILKDYGLDYARELNNIGVLYIKLDQLDEAEYNCQKAIRVLDSLSLSVHPQYTSTLISLASICQIRHAYTDAEQYYHYALSIQQTNGDTLGPLYAGLYNNLGVLFESQMNYKKAKEYYEKALVMRRKIYGKHHLEYAVSLKHVSDISFKEKDYSKGLNYFQSCVDILKENYIPLVNYLSDNQREKYWNYARDYFLNDYPSFAYRGYPHNPSISKWVYDNELFIKGLLLSSSNAVKNSILESNDDTLIRKWIELTEKKQQIMAWEKKHPQSTKLISLKEYTENLEKEVTRASATYRENMRQWEITWDSIKAALEPNQVAIEYVCASLDGDSKMYYAMLLRDTSFSPIMIPLFEEDEISSRLRNIIPQNWLTLSQHIWNNILPYLKEGESVYFAPVGLLHQIPIENLPYDSIRTMNDVFNMVRLSSTREIVLHPKTYHNKTAALFGDINYYASIDELAGESARYGTFASRSLKNDTIDRGRVTYLPGTREEIENIQQTLLSSHINVVSFSKVSATEESFKALSGTHTNIIHLATHGFYWEDPTAKQEKFFAQHISGLGEEFQLNVSIDPLDRCGLLFAGANTALSGHSNRIPKNVQDGVLTAKEISNMDLRDADIVILSACETGLGDISGEGVFGLQRAFKMAGAQSILMALWKVDDEATKTLMTAFYRYYCQGNNKRQALRLAQQEVRKNGYSNPYYWAGFVLLD